MSACPVDDWDFDEEPLCHVCGGEGVIITCFDDMCIGQGYCIHGDGQEFCTACDEGFARPDPPTLPKRRTRKPDPRQGVLAL